MALNSTTHGTAPTRRVVAGVDFSDNAAHAAAWAAQAATDRGLPLHLAYALDLPTGMGEILEPVEYAEKHRAAGGKLLGGLRLGFEQQHPGLAVSTEISERGAAETLVLLSRGAELVVTGSRGHGGFAGMLLGSVSLKLAAHARCPAIVVRGHDRAAANEIVLGVEPGQAEAPIRFAFQTAARLGAKVRAVRVWWPDYGYSAGTYSPIDIPAVDRDQGSDLGALLKEMREAYPGTEVSTSVMHDNPVPALLEAAQAARLLVIGAHRHRGPLSVGAGYVVQGVLSHSSTPVAVVPIV
jgi:nucleotide-binding universal stress UspA family protein